MLATLEKLNTLSQENSLEAFDKSQPKHGTRRQRVLVEIQMHVNGLTDEEIGERLGDPGMNKLRPRRVELYRLGLIRANGIRKTKSGMDATVWEVVPKEEYKGPNMPDLPKLGPSLADVVSIARGLLFGTTLNHFNHKIKELGVEC